MKLIVVLVSEHVRGRFRSTELPFHVIAGPVAWIMSFLYVSSRFLLVVQIVSHAVDPMSGLPMR